MKEKINNIDFTEADLEALQVKATKKLFAIFYNGKWIIKAAIDVFNLREKLGAEVFDKADFIYEVNKSVNHKDSYAAWAKFKNRK